MSSGMPVISTFRARQMPMIAPIPMAAYSMAAETGCRLRLA